MSGGPRGIPEARLAVRVTPRAGRDEVGGVRDGALILRVTAAPVEGAATAAVIRLVAASLAIPASRVRLIAGASGRRKILAVTGLDQAAIVARWPDLGV